MILERIRRGERVDHYDTVRRRKDGSLVEISLTVSPVRDQHGRIVGASKIARDISGRRRQEQERELRVGELRHRVKNLLAIVGAIASQTAVDGPSAQSIATISWAGSRRSRRPRGGLPSGRRRRSGGADHSSARPLCSRRMERVRSSSSPVRGERCRGSGSRRLPSSCTSLPPMPSSTVRSSKPEGRLRLAWSTTDAADGALPAPGLAGAGRPARSARLHRRGLA